MSYPRPFHGHIIHLYSALVTVNVSLISFLSESRPCATQRSQDSKARPLSSYKYSCAPSFPPTHHTLSGLFRPRTIQCGSPDKKAEAMAGVLERKGEVSSNPAIPRINPILYTRQWRLYSWNLGSQSTARLLLHTYIAFTQDSMYVVQVMLYALWETRQNRMTDDP